MNLWINAVVLQMLRLATIAFLLAVILPISLSAAKRKYDERGNLATVPESAENLGPQSQSEQTSPKEEIKPTMNNVPVFPEKSTASEKTATADINDAAREESETLSQQKIPLTKVYLENAQMYLRTQRLDKALEFLKKSQDSGEDAFSREARLIALALRARRGDQGLESEAEGMDEKVKAQAFLRIADGYYSCARENPKKSECLSEAERLYALTSELAPRSTEGKLARVRLGFLLVDAGRLEAALPHLTQTLLTESTDEKSGAELPLDRVYFNLGQLYERPWYHRDTHKAQQAYKQVLKYSGSPYHKAARERLTYLERFGVGYKNP